MFSLPLQCGLLNDVWQSVFMIQMFTGVIAIETAIVGGLIVGRQRPIARGEGPGLGREIGPLNLRRGSAAVAGRESQRGNVAGIVVEIVTSVIGTVSVIGIATGTETGKGM